MERNALFARVLSNVSEENKARFELNYAISAKIDAILRGKGITQRELARRMGKSEGEVSRWLSGQHRFTIGTVTKIELALGSRILTIAE